LTDHFHVTVDEIHLLSLGAIIPDRDDGNGSLRATSVFTIPPSGLTSYIGKNEQPDHFGPILIDKVNDLVF
jgi:hypothetical protein